MKLDDLDHEYKQFHEDGDIIVMFRAVLFWCVGVVAIVLLVVWWIGG